MGVCVLGLDVWCVCVFMFVCVFMSVCDVCVYMCVCLVWMCGVCVCSHLCDVCVWVCVWFECVVCVFTSVCVYAGCVYFSIYGESWRLNHSEAASRGLPSPVTGNLPLTTSEA